MIERSLVAMAVAITSIGALACGCVGNPDPNLVYVEEFEDLCDGVPCGWVQSGGEPGAATFVETVPGEHGIQLVGDGPWVRGPIPEPLATSPTANVIQTRMIARCDTGSSIELRLTIEAPGGQTTTFGTEIVPEDVWRSPLPDQTLDPVAPTSSSWTIERILGVSMLKHGDGSCEVNYLAIRAVNGF